MTARAAIGSLARRQHGLVTIHQLLDAGNTPGQLRRLIREGELTPVRRGVYRLNGVPITWPQTVLAAVLASGDGAVASHATAAALWDLKTLRRDGGSLHITSPRQGRLIGVRSHIKPLSGKDRRTRLGIPVTGVERTVMDIATSLTPTELGQCVDDALRRGLLRLERLRHSVEQANSRGRPSLGALHSVLADRLEGYDPGGSDWERDMDRLWDKLGLPHAVRQHPVTANGHRYILDRALPELKIGIEWNGFATHGSRSAFDYDSNRRADLTAEGWHMVDFTSRSSRDRLVAAVHGAIRLRTTDIG